MKQIKKSFNMPENLSTKVDDFVEANPGINFTFVVVQALENWLKNPQIILNSASETKSEATVKRPNFGHVGRNSPIRQL